MSPKGIILMVFYMIIIYTVFHTFTAAARTDGFSMGGTDTEKDILQKGYEVDTYEATLENISEGDTIKQRFDAANVSFGWYQGKKFHLSIWVPVFEMDHLWLKNTSSGRTQKWMQESEFDDTIIRGVSTNVSVGFFAQVDRALGTIWNAFGYLFDLITFNVASSGPTFDSVDGQMIDDPLPGFLTWIPLLLVLIPWILIIYWLFPIFIKLVNAIGSVIRVPFAG